MDKLTEWLHHNLAMFRAKVPTCPLWATIDRFWGKQHKCCPLSLATFLAHINEVVPCARIDTHMCLSTCLYRISVSLLAWATWLSMLYTTFITAVTSLEKPLMMMRWSFLFLSTEILTEYTGPKHSMKSTYNVHGPIKYSRKHYTYVITKKSKTTGIAENPPANRYTHITSRFHAVVTLQLYTFTIQRTLIRPYRVLFGHLDI